MRTTPAVREFTDDPLPDEVLYEILDDEGNVVSNVTIQSLVADFEAST